MDLSIEYRSDFVIDGENCIDFFEGQRHIYMLEFKHGCEAIWEAPSIRAGFKA